MKLIILAGENNSGKTTILKALSTALQLKGAKSLKLTLVGNSDEDAEYELYYCGHTVVICTLGDYSDNLKNYCEQYKLADMLICATRKDFRKTNYIRKIAIKSFSGKQILSYIDALNYVSKFK